MNIKREEKLLGLPILKGCYNKNGIKIPQTTCCLLLETYFPELESYRPLPAIARAISNKLFKQYNNIYLQLWLLSLKEARYNKTIGSRVFMDEEFAKKHFNIHPSDELYYEE